MMRTIWLGLLLVGIQVRTACGQPGRIPGMVTDSLTGEPVEGARVEIIGGSETTLTDSAGRFVLGTTAALERFPSHGRGPGDSPARGLPETFAADGSRVSRSGRREARGPRFSEAESDPGRTSSPGEAGRLAKAAGAVMLRIDQKRFQVREMEIPAGDSDVQVKLSQKNGWQLDAATTGLAGLGIDKNTLPEYTGPGTPPRGTVIRMKKITVPLWLKNGDITIDRCWFQPNSSLPGALIVTYDYNNGASAPSPSTITDSDLDGSLIGVADVAYQCAVRGMATVRRCNIFGMGTGIAIYGSLKSDILVEQNYVHGLRAYGNGATSGSHNEAATIRGYLGNSLIFRNNRLVCRTGNDTGGLFIQAWAEAINHVLVTGNQLESGGYGMPLEAHDRGYGADMRAVNNRFVTVAGGYGPAYVTGGPGWAQWSDNFIDDPARADHKGKAIAEP